MKDSCLPSIPVDSGEPGPRLSCVTVDLDLDLDVSRDRVGLSPCCMPPPDQESEEVNEEWGPLAHLIGEWEGTGGLDTAFSHSRGEVIATPYLEKVTMKPFGPVDNGSQQLFGLDYKTAMWRDNEENPFHTEVGYWLWDARAGEVLRCFSVPRGITVTAGGNTTAESREFSMSAGAADSPYRIGENHYLAANASTVSYEVTISVVDENSWSYSETTMLRMNEFPELFAHTDANTLRRVG
jgi:hypothetical protein